LQAEGNSITVTQFMHGQDKILFSTDCPVFMQDDIRGSKVKMKINAESHFPSHKHLMRWNSLNVSLLELLLGTLVGDLMIMAGDAGLFIPQ